MADPADEAAVAALRDATGWDVQQAIADRAELARVIRSVYGGAPAGGPREEPIEIRLEEPRAPAMPEGLHTDGTADSLHVNDLLERVLDLGGSDLHLTVGIHPTVRVHG